MAGDWIKMRGSLMTHPKVLRMALAIGQHPEIGEKFLGKPGALLEYVTRDVTRDMVIGALLRLWSATNEHTCDGVWQKVELQDLDEIAGIPEFCRFLETVGWLEYDFVKETATLPNFLEYNVPAKNGARSPAAKRQADYRARKQAENITTGDVTRDVTVTPREEKRREENIKESKALSASRKAKLPDDFYPDETGLRKAHDAKINIAAELERFTDFHKAKGTLMLDWQAAWRTWVSNAVKFARQPTVTEQKAEKDRIWREKMFGTEKAING